MPASKAVIRRSLKDAIKQFRNLQRLLLSGDIDERLLRDFRAALNRVRNTAWGVQQYIGQKDVGQDPASLLTILAGERVRAAYGLCKAISSDLKRPDITFQAGSLVQLQEVVQKLGSEINALMQEQR